MEMMNLTVGAPSSQGTVKATWDLPSGSVTMPTDPSYEAELYKITWNGQEFTCNNVYNGNTKYNYAYQENGVDIIAIVVLKSDETVQVVTRFNELPYVESNTVTLTYTEPTPPTPTDEAIKTTLIKLSEDVIIEVKYNPNDDSVTAEKKGA